MCCGTPRTSPRPPDGSHIPERKRYGRGLLPGHLLMRATPPLDQADGIELGFDDVAVEGLEDVFVGAGGDGAGDMRGVVLGRAEDHLRRARATLAAESDEEGDAIHHRHIPVE